MRVRLLACAAMFAAMVSGAAFADDPNDPTMRSAAARERDRAEIRRLNLQQLAMVRARDAEYAQGWRAAKRNGNPSAARAEYSAAAQDHERDMADYDRSRAQYQRDMAEWRRAVAECRQGNYAACDN